MQASKFKVVGEQTGSQDALFKFARFEPNSHPSGRLTSHDNKLTQDADAVRQAIMLKVKRHPTS